jgi:hypothetical protein
MAAFLRNANSNLLFCALSRWWSRSDPAIIVKGFWTNGKLSKHPKLRRGGESRHKCRRAAKDSQKAKVDKLRIGFAFLLLEAHVDHSKENYSLTSVNVIVYRLHHVRHECRCGRSFERRETGRNEDNAMRAWRRVMRYCRREYMPGTTSVDL